MHVEVIEVVARIADSIVAIAHVGAEGRYRIGTAPEVELPVAAGALRCFPLVDVGLVVRRPAGIPATLFADGQARALEEIELRLQPGARIELALGQVVLSIALVTRPVVAVPKPRFDRRPLCYGAAVLAAHLVVWSAAMLLVPLERIGVEVEVAPRPPRVRVAHVEPPTPPTPPPPAVANPSPPPPPTSDAPARRGPPSDPRARAVASAREAGPLGATGLSDVSSLIPTVDVVKLVNEAVFYDEDKATHGSFGNSRRFDPTANCTDCGTVATGRYATVASGHGAGDDYDLPGAVNGPPPVVSICASSACQVVGGISRTKVRKEIELRAGYFSACYQRLASRTDRGTVLLDFAIGTDGTVTDAHGSGMGDVGDCVADIVTAIPFPAAPEGTRVTYPVSFRPS